MANHQPKVKPSDVQKPDRMVSPKKFAGRAALISELNEAPAAAKPALGSNFSMVPDQILGQMTSEREISDQVGAPMRIVTIQQLGQAIGLDAADRFLADAEKGDNRKI